MKCGEKRTGKSRGKWGLMLFLLFALVWQPSYACIESWSCSDWLVCKNSTQTRTCIDFGYCGSEANKPITTFQCGEPVYEENKTDDTSITLIETNLSLPLCGNGRIEPGETYLNCNQDIRPTIDDFFNCILAGEEKCNYYKRYTDILMVLLLVVLAFIAAESKHFFKEKKS